MSDETNYLLELEMLIKKVKRTITKRMVNQRRAAESLNGLYYREVRNAGEFKKDSIDLNKLETAWRRLLQNNEAYQQNLKELQEFNLKIKGVSYGEKENIQGSQPRYSHT